MARQVESAHAWMELAAYNIEKFKDRRLLNDRIGGMTALLKVQATDVYNYCAREAAQIFGGLAYTKGGQGGKVERLYRGRFKSCTIDEAKVLIFFSFRIQQRLNVRR